MSHRFGLRHSAHVAPAGAHFRIWRQERFEWYWVANVPTGDPAGLLQSVASGYAWTKLAARIRAQRALESWAKAQSAERAET